MKLKTKILYMYIKNLYKHPWNLQYYSILILLKKLDLVNGYNHSRVGSKLKVGVGGGCLALSEILTSIKKKGLSNFAKKVGGGGG